ncbi:MAG: hypothetical protein V4726_03385 [Verrucomicrobiota bacterium]
MKSRIICLSCGEPLTNLLQPVGEHFEVTWPDSENIIPKGHYWIADEDMGILAGRIMIHLEDRRGMKNHPDSFRFQGCCGASDGRINLLCECGAEVATEVSDCWTSYYAHFEPEAALLQPSSETANQAEQDDSGNSSAARASP